MVRALGDERIDWHAEPGIYIVQSPSTRLEAQPLGSTSRSMLVPIHLLSVSAERLSREELSLSPLREEMKLLVVPIRAGHGVRKCR